MATATVGTMIFIGSKTGRTYSALLYTADTAAYINKYSVSGTPDGNALQYCKFPEPVVLVDFSIPTGMTQTNLVMTDNGTIRNGTLLNVVVHVSTNSNRPKLAIPFDANVNIGSNTL